MLVQGKVRDRLPKPGILNLEFLQPLHLVQIQAAILLPPPAIRHLGHPNLLNRVGQLRPLRNKEIHLPQLGDDLFTRVLLPWNVLILLDAVRHTSSRTTSVEVDHAPPGRGFTKPKLGRTPFDSDFINSYNLCRRKEVAHGLRKRLQFFMAHPAKFELEDEIGDLDVVTIVEIVVRFFPDCRREDIIAKLQELLPDDPQPKKD